MSKWKKLEDDEDEENSEEQLENIIEEFDASALSRTLSQAITPILETTSRQEPLELGLRNVRTETEETNTNEPNYSLNNTYMSDSAYQSSESLMSSPSSLQPQSMSQSSQQMPSAPGYPNQKSQTKNYESNLEQQAKKQRENRRRF